MVCFSGLFRRGLSRLVERGRYYLLWPFFGQQERPSRFELCNQSLENKNLLKRKRLNGLWQDDYTHPIYYVTLPYQFRDVHSSKLIEITEGIVSLIILNKKRVIVKSRLLLRWKYKFLFEINGHEIFSFCNCTSICIVKETR